MMVGSLRLSTQTSVGELFAEVLWKAATWSSDFKTARSFRIAWFRHTDYHGARETSPTGYSSFEVEYFSTNGDGWWLEKIPLDKSSPEWLAWSRKVVDWPIPAEWFGGA